MGLLANPVEHLEWLGVANIQTRVFLRFGKDVAELKLNAMPEVRGAVSNVVGFRTTAENRLDWFKWQLSRLSPASPDYESEKRAINGACQELRELIRRVTEQH